MNSIPFFYYDLTARIAPGMLAIALLRLTTFGFPPPWRTWPALHYALGQPVLLPLIYGGVAYLIGMFLDVMLGPVIRPLYEPSFRRAVDGYRWLRPSPVGADDAASENVTMKDVSRWSFDAYMIRAEKDLAADLTSPRI